MKRCDLPMTAIVLWLGLCVVALLFALVWVMSMRDVTEVQLDRAHWAGMELGQTMCQGFRAEPERAHQPASRRQRGGLL